MKTNFRYKKPLLMQRCLRPIFLTTATTIGGLIPLYLGGGPMWEPLAVAIMFGLGFATLLTLGLVPVLYAIFFKIKFKDFVFSEV
ncbi:MAG: efflux RND transporter permease subunit [Calditrichia bacterium]|nr:efflux RND transporter permease subunit [Calditrichia bacterium]